MACDGGHLATLQPVRNTEEAKRKGTAGGKASGKSRRSKKTVRDCVKAMLAERVARGALMGRLADIAEAFGITEEDTNAVLLASSLLMRATEGDEQALDRVLSMVDDGGKAETFRASALFVMPSSETVEKERAKDADENS